MIDIRELKQDEYYKITETLLDNNTIISMESGGSSMFPTIKAGEKLLVQTKFFKDLTKGDIVVRRMNGKLIAHRVVGYENDSIITQGDNSFKRDFLMYKDDYIGLVIGKNKAGEYLYFTSFRFCLVRYFYVNFGLITRIVGRFCHKSNRLVSRLQK